MFSASPSSIDPAPGLSPFESVDLSHLQPTPEALALVSPGFARRHTLLPLSCSAGCFRIAIGGPLEMEGIDSLRDFIPLEIVPVIAPPNEISTAIDRWYGQTGAAQNETGCDSSVEPGDFSPEAGFVNEAIAPDANDAPIIQQVHAVIDEAVQRRASDIHFEPLKSRFRVRYRIDGVLREGRDLPQVLQLSMVSRLKIMANISIAEKRIPQDGRIPMVVAGRVLDLRVSSLPTAHGESVVLRLLEPGSLPPGLAELGFLAEDRKVFERLITLPDGIILVTGPTGSGKTTTLYSCLQSLNHPDRKIITVEDPVEYQLAGINQVPVRQDIGMTFAAALRAMLRQSPNVVMVGEIRDRETAEISIHASLTGHLVFSTLHTNDAPGAISRLVDIGVRPFLVATSLRAILAQRLVRRVCVHCAVPYQPRPDELAALDFTASQTIQARFRKGRGCAECDGSGYRGRLAIFELLVINDELQTMIHHQAGTVNLRQKARSMGMHTLREDGLRKITAGLTTIEEVVSITADDSH